MYMQSERGWGSVIDEARGDDPVRVYIGIIANSHGYFLRDILI